jgi:DNA-binding NtrC family response regulator
LTDKFLNDVAEEYGDASKEFDPDAMEYMKTLPWTGNVRELRNVVERLVIMCGTKITLDDVKLYAGIGF